MRVEGWPAWFCALTYVALWLTAISLTLLFTAPSSRAQTFTSLFSFDYSDGVAIADIRNRPCRSFLHGDSAMKPSSNRVDRWD